MDRPELLKDVQSTYERGTKIFELNYFCLVMFIAMMATEVNYCFQLSTESLTFVKNSINNMIND